MIFVRLCGGMLVVIFTAISEESFISRLGILVGMTFGIFFVSL